MTTSAEIEIYPQTEMNLKIAKPDKEITISPLSFCLISCRELLIDMWLPRALCIFD